MDSAPVDGAQVLTPGHFLVGRSLKALPELPDTASNITFLRRWNRCKRLSHEIWTKWSQDYLHLLQIQYNNYFPHRSIQVGDIVLLKDPELFDRSWPLAIVRAVHPGPDGLVRVVPWIHRREPTKEPSSVSFLSSEFLNRLPRRMIRPRLLTDDHERII